MRFNRYLDLIEQTFYFPQENFSARNYQLYFNKISLMDLIEKYGTPLKITYLPKISTQIQRAKKIFNVAIAKASYKGTYTYCYCTKSSQFSFVMEEVLKNDVQLETSSAFDIPIIRKLYEMGKFKKESLVICNGYKRHPYLKNITDLINDGFNVIPILDNKEEINFYEKAVKNKCNIGIRIAAEEEPSFVFYTSRLGIRYNDIVDFYKEKIQNHKKISLKMLHFFINTGIRDTAYFWSELTKCINVYCALKKICPSLDSFNIGGGFPFRNSLSFNYDYEFMADQIIEQIKSICIDNKVPEPNIFTEFGSYTVAESGATLFSVMTQKRQNDKELWYMVDGSFITMLPDTWGIGQRFILLPVNNWDHDYHQVNLGGLSCDSHDYYNSDVHINQVFMPKLNDTDTQYIGFFNTGAYQESLGGYGGIQHCLLPAPKHILIDKDEKGNIISYLYAKEQSYKSMLKILGY